MIPSRSLLSGDAENPTFYLPLSYFNVSGTSHKFQKNPHIRKMFCPQFWGRKWLRQFYGHLEQNAFFMQEKPMSIKFLLLGGGGGFWGGGGVPILFLWARGFF